MCRVALVDGHSLARTLRQERLKEEILVMWLPKSESDIIKAVQSRSLEESAIFDAKEELSKNTEIAKDIAAMANDGGVIIYGLGEDEHGRIARSTPITLEGQAEKIDAIVRSSISEPPVIYISSIPTVENPEVGYLVVHIPPSERAPHMVVVKGDHRFYGRTATGNNLLSEGEVARLYARRQLSEVNREKLLDAEIHASPLEPNENFAYLFLYTRPVFAKENFFDPILSSEINLQSILNELVHQVSKNSIYDRGFSPDFNPPPSWKYRAEGYWGQLSYPPSEKSEVPRDTLNLQIDFDGSGHLFCGRAAHRYLQRDFLVFSELIAGLTVRFGTYMAKLYEKSKYIGMVDMGLAITGLNGSVVHTNELRLLNARTPYDRDMYKKTGRFSALQMLDNPRESSKYLVMPFINAISQGWIDPFQQK